MFEHLRKVGHVEWIGIDFFWKFVILSYHWQLVFWEEGISSIYQSYGLIYIDPSVRLILIDLHAKNVIDQLIGNEARPTTSIVWPTWTTLRDTYNIGKVRHFVKKQIWSIIFWHFCFWDTKLPINSDVSQVQRNVLPSRYQRYWPTYWMIKGD